MHLWASSPGFGLIEVLIATAILTLGLLTVAQLLIASVGAISLARAKDTAATMAQNKLDTLTDLYQHHQGAHELTPGRHGPEKAELHNPTDGSVLNQYDIYWTVWDIKDLRHARAGAAKQVHIEVLPTNSDGNGPLKSFNKRLAISAILSPQKP